MVRSEKNKIKVHFVCLGNAYRSRLAQAYAESLGLTSFEFTSSGIAAHLFEQRLPQYTDLIAKNHELLDFLSPGQIQTTSALLDRQDVIIFMRRDILMQARKQYSLNMAKVHCWNIEDLWQSRLKERITEDDPESSARLAEETFQRIKRDVDRLAGTMTSRGWVDIVDEHNRLLGFSQTIDSANKKRLWHRSIHAIVRTADGHYLVEKRSPKIIIAPSLLDVTLGGYVDRGEEPHHALLRETREELGLDVRPAQVTFLKIIKKSNYHPHYKRHTRGFNYCYLIQLDPGQHDYVIQKEEVSKLTPLSHKKARRLIRRHSLRGLGSLNYTYKFYKENLELAETIKPAS